MSVNKELWGNQERWSKPNPKGDRRLFQAVEILKRSGITLAQGRGKETYITYVTIE